MELETQCSSKTRVAPSQERELKCYERPDLAEGLGSLLHRSVS